MYEIQESGMDDPLALVERDKVEQSVNALKTPLKPHGCPRCSKSFSSVHQLAQHTRVHTGEKPYKCPFCDRRFKQQSHVKQHSRLHTGERPYKCSVPSCGRSFVQLSNLQQHMGNHAKDPGKVRELNFHCHICGKGFASESSLGLHYEKKHQDTSAAERAYRHQKSKPFTCSTCSKSYTTESALQIHSAKHKQSPSNDTNSSASPPTIKAEAPPLPSESRLGFGCRLCPETFISTDGLEEHMKIAHSCPPPYLPYCPPPHHAIPGSSMWFDPQSLHYTGVPPLLPASPPPSGNPSRKK